MSLFAIPRKVALRLKFFSNFLSDGWLVGGRGGGDALDKKPHLVKWLIIYITGGRVGHYKFVYISTWPSCIFLLIQDLI